MDGIERQRIEWEISQLVNRFSHCIDKARYDELAGLFTEDGIFDRIGEILTGREEIVAAMARRHPFLTRHTVSCLSFTRVGADEAEASLYVANFVGQPPAGDGPVAYQLPQPAMLDFDDLYRRTADGWRIARRVAKVIIKPAAVDH